MCRYDSRVTITYNEAIDAATVNANTFVVHALQSTQRYYDYSVNGGAIQYAHDLPFAAGELIEVSATTGTLNLNGESPISPTVWQFRIKPVSEGGEYSSVQTSNAGIVWDIELGDLNGDVGWMLSWLLKMAVRFG